MREIKIILAFFLVSTIFGCSGDDNTKFFYELVPIEEVMIPSEFNSNETYRITVSYYRPSDCHAFNGFDYDRLDNERTVAVVNVVVDRDNCRAIERLDLIDVSFDFLVGQEESYIFRFWQGKNENGDNQFLTIEVPVVQ
ncbi:hypothetical protein [Aquimarina mytili]|uniref:Lipoprotein n=1 Tax=Aquimarina mytili TaxID=874423 RepID=A0A937A428_9FLAO|nr:hypothetical protein [Aquimarina mytili]MBL0684560.1 hypothetical protein [Aquimarina mytili]